MRTRGWKLMLALIVVSALAIAGSAAGKSKRAMKKPEYSGPIARSFSKTAPLTNGVSATVTIIGDQSQEEQIMSSIERFLAEARRLDMDINASPNGAVARINNLGKGQKAQLGPDAFDLIAKSKNLAAVTNGWFDIAASAGKGFFSSKDYRKLKLNKDEKTFAFKSDNMKLDLGNIWPAYLTDKLMTSVVSAGYANAKVQVGNTSRNVGRDIHTPWMVSIRLHNPGSRFAHRSYAYSFSNKAVAELTPELIAKPLVDPKTKKEVGQNFRNVTVFAQDAMTAEALALAIYTIGAKGVVPFIEKHPEVKVICVNNKGEFITSKGLNINAQAHGQAQASNATPATDQGPQDTRMRKKEVESGN